MGGWGVVLTVAWLKPVAQQLLRRTGQGCFKASKWQRWSKTPPTPFLPGIWMPPPLGSGVLWGIYLFKHGWFLERRVSGFKVGDWGKQKVGGLDK